ncbi:ATP/GTP binding protein [Alloactinosynnema sp. L-07]|uniref:hypothetical protein n=1 Tax=Alloactinosynnema sp. L-07 TaxID=1653480 RepID=UPI00065EFBC1|nr:hypothetical protein [Alloactinosynnema sp. L-07]CRK57024.1 ATP/GTP binding protein [Alloactinosynnema sp. L-07]
MTTRLHGIIWLNGAFGAGKTSVATSLLDRIPNAALYDPEEVGFMLRKQLPGWTGDFQDLPGWRSLVVHTARTLLDHTGGPLIAPMSVLNERYAYDIFGGFDYAGIAVRHIVLHADPPSSASGSSTTPRTAMESGTSGSAGWPRMAPPTPVGCQRKQRSSTVLGAIPNNSLT